ncbi:MAG: divergent polysaccharide deacetylase family protein [Alphaproteobacteria bacterium]|nr:divergent polysaccharide deacetylase family protein [Alphaproteobacteria bacterium]
MMKSFMVAVAGFAVGMGVTTALTFIAPVVDGSGLQANTPMARGPVAVPVVEQRISLLPLPPETRAAEATPAKPPSQPPARGEVEKLPRIAAVKESRPPSPPAPLIAAPSPGPAMPVVKQAGIVAAPLAEPEAKAEAAPDAKTQSETETEPETETGLKLEPGPEIEPEPEPVQMARVEDSAPPAPFMIDVMEARRREQIEHENVRLAKLSKPPVLPPAPAPPPARATVPDAPAGAAAALTRADPAAAPRPTWQRFAALTPAFDAQNPALARIAIVLDDMGLSQFRSDRAIALPRPITLAILPYGNHLAGLVARARTAGHEILVHLPMEPKDADADPGPNALLTGLPVAELDRRIASNLARLDGYVGINNHMGSLFTGRAREMRRVMRALQDRQLLFLDSLTTGNSTGYRLAREYGIPTVMRDVFLDNDRHPIKIRRQLELTVETALKRGQAIAIGHPYPETLSALESWLPSLRARGLMLVPISALVRQEPPKQSG